MNGESLALVMEICGQLDGLPLAIELAAARVASLGLGPVRDKLDARFRLLTGGSRTSLRRHQTLRAALEWSHSLLNEAERAVFRRLGVFAGGFTIGLAQAVASDEQLDEWVVLDQLGALVDKSLVVADAGIAPRYHLLESARAFALEQLAADETEAVLRRHALAMRDFIEQADSANLDCELRSDQFAALVLPELDNLRAARAWAIGKMGDLQIAIEIATHAAAASTTQSNASTGSCRCSGISKAARWTVPSPHVTGAPLPPATWPAACLWPFRPKRRLARWPCIGSLASRAAFSPH